VRERRPGFADGASCADGERAHIVCAPLRADPSAVHRRWRGPEEQRAPARRSRSDVTDASSRCWCSTSIATSTAPTPARTRLPSHSLWEGLWRKKSRIAWGQPRCEGRFPGESRV